MILTNPSAYKFEASSSAKHLAPILNFENNFNSVVKSSDDSKILDFLNNFITLRPLSRSLLKQVHQSFRATYRFQPLANDVAELVAEATHNLRDKAKKEYGVSPVFESFNMFKKLDHIMPQLRNTMFLLKSGCLTEKPLMCIPENQSTTVNSLTPYLNEAFNLVSSPIETRSALRYMNIAPYDSEFFLYSKEKSGYFEDFLPTVITDLKQREAIKKTLSLKNLTKEIAINYLQKYDFSEDEEYVIVYLNDNTNIIPDIAELYAEALNWLSKTGIKIFNLGNAKNPNIPGVIHFMGSQRPFEVDIYLAATAKFYLGGKNGISELASSFGKRTNIFFGSSSDAADPNAFVNCARLIEQKSNKLISKKRMDKLKISLKTSPEILQYFGFDFKQIRSFEILNFTKEALNFKEQKKARRDKKTYNSLAINENINQLCSESKALFLD